MNHFAIGLGAILSGLLFGVAPASAESQRARPDLLIQSTGVEQNGRQLSLVVKNAGAAAARAFRVNVRVIRTPATSTLVIDSYHRGVLVAGLQAGRTQVLKLNGPEGYIFGERISIEYRVDEDFDPEFGLPVGGQIQESNEGNNRASRYFIARPAPNGPGPIR